MLIVVVSDNTDPVTGRLHLSARTLADRDGVLHLLARTAPVLSAGRLILTARTQRRRTVRLRLSARTAPRVTAEHLVLGARTAPRQSLARLHLSATTRQYLTMPVHQWPRRTFHGAPPLRYRTTVSVAGISVTDHPVLSWSYQQAAWGRTLTLTLAGEVRIPRGAGISLRVQELTTGLDVSYSDIPATGDYRISRLARSGARTEVTARDSDYDVLRNHKLTELVPWVNNPSQELKSASSRTIIRQVIGVDELLQAAFASATVSLTNQAPVFGSETWEETRRETSTEGRSPLDLIGESYGLLNYELVREGDQSFRLFQPGEYRLIRAADPRGLLPFDEARETTQYPPSVTLRAANWWTQYEEGYFVEAASSGSLPDATPDEHGKVAAVEVRDPVAATFEVQRAGVIGGYTLTQGRYTVFWVRKTAGRVVASGEVIVGDVTVTKEVNAVYDQWTPTAVDGVEVIGTVVATATKKFLNVVLSRTDTTYTYLSSTSKTLASTLTRRRRFAYVYDRVPLASADIPKVIDVPVTAVQGDLLAEEGSLDQNVWSHAGGLLRQRTVTEWKISAIGQVDAQLDPEDGANSPVPQAMDMSVNVTTEGWQAVGQGLYLHHSTKVTATKLPVMDLSTGEWVKTITSPSTSVTHELTETAPPSSSDEQIPSPEDQAAGTEAVADGSQFPEYKFFQDVQEVTLVLDSESLAAPATLELPFVFAKARLSVYGNIWATEAKPRVRRQLRTRLPMDLNVRDSVEGYGLVRSVRASGGPGTYQLEADCEQRDP